MRGLLAGLGGVVVQPAQLELVPGVHVARQVTDGLLAGAEPGAGGHQRPETGGVVAAGGVVLVRQAEVVAVLVGEDAEAAVLRLDGVVADPDAGVADLRAAELVVLGAGGAGVGAEGVPAVGPDRVLALGAAAGGLVLTGVHDLEVVDVAVRLVEVAVAVEVVAVPLVVLGEVLLDVGVGAAGLLLLGDPGVQAVADDVPHARAVGVAAGVVAVTGLVVGDLDPVGDLTGDRVAARGLLLVVLLQRLGLLAGAEVEVLVVLLVVVLLPGRRVVLLAVRRGDLVVQRARGAAELGVGLVAELHQDREDLVGLLAAQLDVLALALAALELDDLGAVALLRGGLARYELVQGLLTLCLLGLAQGAVQVVRALLHRSRIVPAGRGVPGLGARLRDGEGGERGGGRRERHADGGRSERPGSAGHLSSSPAPRTRTEGSGSWRNPCAHDQRV